ncbi:MAG: hypothetical protein IJ321_00990 [Alistipes sp.]|uniref:hypothetical protein n=1 Tax=Alistipes sp. TaxID=1872444 RepID=UPI0023F52598|nr:hypothetical protein [Alistipes sp.]MBQ7892501.1 hypothetical protein [Alistipes sp.]
MTCAGPPALCAQELSGGVSAMTEASSFGIGMIGLINTTSPWPVFPMLVYRHRFDKRWSMEIMPPQFRLTCAVNPSNRITAGLAIDGDRFYGTPRNPQLPKVCLYSKKPYAAGIEIE